MSKYFFNKLSDVKGPEGITAGGGYWLARISYLLGNAKEANYFLKKAATKDRTFYGSLAMASLGYKYNPNFDLPKYDQKLINKITKHNFRQIVSSPSQYTYILVLQVLQNEHGSIQQAKS